MDSAWIDITQKQPEQYARVLVKMIGGAVRLTNYDKYCYEHWPVTHWKSVPENNGQKRV
jgi:hypothetical protein